MYLFRIKSGKKRRGDRRKVKDFLKNISPKNKSKSKKELLKTYGKRPKLSKTTPN